VSDTWANAHKALADAKSYVDVYKKTKYENRTEPERVFMALYNQLEELLLANERQAAWLRELREWQIKHQKEDATT